MGEIETNNIFQNRTYKTNQSKNTSHMGSRMGMGSILMKPKPSKNYAISGRSSPSDLFKKYSITTEDYNNNNNSHNVGMTVLTSDHPNYENTRIDDNDDIISYNDWNNSKKCGGGSVSGGMTEGNRERVSIGSRISDLSQSPSPILTTTTASPVVKSSPLYSHPSDVPMPVNKTTANDANDYNDDKLDLYLAWLSQQQNTAENETAENSNFYPQDSIATDTTANDAVVSPQSLKSDIAYGLDLQSPDTATRARLDSSLQSSGMCYDVY